VIFAIALLCLVPSTSLMFLPYTVEGEVLPAGFQFAREKARTLASWADALAGGPEPPVVKAPMADWAPVGALEAREPRPERRLDLTGGRGATAGPLQATPRRFPGTT